MEKHSLISHYVYGEFWWGVGGGDGVESSSGLHIYLYGLHNYHCVTGRSLRAFYFTNMFFAIINILLISYLKYILLLAIEDPLMIQTVAVICLVAVKTSSLFRFLRNLDRLSRTVKQVHTQEGFYIFQTRWLM